MIGREGYIPSSRYPSVLGPHGGPRIPESLSHLLWLCEGLGGLYVAEHRERLCDILGGGLGWGEQGLGDREDFVG